MRDITFKGRRRAASLAAALALIGGVARGQAPTILEGPGTGTANPGSAAPTLGPIPGSGGGRFDDQPVGGGQILGGRPGTATPRVPASIADPGAGTTPMNPNAAFAVPAVAPLTEVPLYGNLELAPGDDEGPPDGLTFDAALDLLIKYNGDLAARRFEIPLAEADVLTAGLRNNPILYADSQLVPYGHFDPRTRPGGPTQYDLNVSQPIDYARKRKYRLAVAVQARRGVEAQYQDAVRLGIANLANAYVSALAARETVRYVANGLRGLDQVLDTTRKLAARGNRTAADVARVEAQRGASAVGLLDAEEAERRALRTLGGLLNLPPGQAESLRLRAGLRDDSPPPPPDDQLAAMALQCRPDVVGYRIGVRYAGASLDLQKANRFADAYLLYQPYTFQDNRPTHQNGAHSYAVGVTVPLPLINRNQGNIERARINIDQTRAQLAALERQVVVEVRQAAREYAATRDYLARLESTVLPPSRKAVEDTRKLFAKGEIADVTLLLNIQREANDLVRQYRDTAVRHRRSMYGLNTAVGRRILP